MPSQYPLGSPSPAARPPPEALHAQSERKQPRKREICEKKGKNSARSRPTGMRDAVLMTVRISARQRKTRLTITLCVCSARSGRPKSQGGSRNFIKSPNIMMQIVGGCAPYVAIVPGKPVTIRAYPLCGDTPQRPVCYEVLVLHLKTGGFCVWAVTRWD